LRNLGGIRTVGFPLNQPFSPGKTVEKENPRWMVNGSAPEVIPTILGGMKRMPTVHGSDPWNGSVFAQENMNWMG